MRHRNRIVYYSAELLSFVVVPAARAYFLSKSPMPVIFDTLGIVVSYSFPWNREYEIFNVKTIATGGGRVNARGLAISFVVRALSARTVQNINDGSFD